MGTIHRRGCVAIMVSAVVDPVKEADGGVSQRHCCGAVQERVRGMHREH